MVTKKKSITLLGVKFRILGNRERVWVITPFDKDNFFKYDNIKNLFDYLEDYMVA